MLETETNKSINSHIKLIESELEDEIIEELEYISNRVIDYLYYYNLEGYEDKVEELFKKIYLSIEILSIKFGITQKIQERTLKGIRLLTTIKGDKNE